MQKPVKTLISVLFFGNHYKLAHIGSGDKSSMRTQSVSQLPNVSDKILGLFEIDPSLSAELGHEILLLSARVDGKDTETTVYGVLDG